MDHQNAADDVTTNVLDCRKIHLVKAENMKDKEAFDASMERHLRQLKQDLASKRHEMCLLSSDAERWKQQAIAAESSHFPVPVYPLPPVSYQGPKAYRPMSVPPQPAVPAAICS